MNAVCPGPVETPVLGDFEQSMGKENLDALVADGGISGAVLTGMIPPPEI